MDELPAMPSPNPFSAAKTRPGALPYIFITDTSASDLVEQLRTNRWWGEIVGPHGSGKSTLLASLTEPLIAAGRHIVPIELHDRQCRLPVSVHELPKLARPPLSDATRPALQIIVDGYEQLSSWNRWRLKLWCRCREAGLLVTSHASQGLPRLHTTEPDPGVAQSLLKTLLGDDTTISDSELLQALEQQQGNLRDAWFQLYDLYEQKRYNR